MFGFAIHPLAYILGVSAIIASLLGAWAWRENVVFNRGYDKAIADVAAKNKGALANVRKATKSVSDCYVANGNWRVDLGVCE
jgi:hypothetical protein